jgi:WD40 repeat protein
MRHCLLALSLLCGLTAVARAQQPNPVPQPEPELGGSTAKATLALNPLGHVGPIRGAFFTPDAKQLITVGKDRTVQLWDVAGGERLRVLRLSFEPTAAALAPDGKTLAIGRRVETGRKVLLINLDDGRVLRLPGVENHKGRTDVLAFSRDGDQLAGSHQGGATPSTWFGRA